MYSRQFAFNSRHGFVLSALTLALMSATDASFALEVGAGATYTTDIIATDDTTTLTVKDGGTVANKKVLLEGGTLNLEVGSLVKTDDFNVLMYQGSSDPFAGRIETKTFTYRGASGNKLGVPLSGTVMGDMFQILNNQNKETGIVISNNDALKEVGEIYVLSNAGGKTGLLTSGSDIRIEALVTLEHKVAGQDVRIEVKDGHSSFASVTTKGIKAIIQTNEGASVDVDYLKVEAGTTTNLQTWKAASSTVQEESHYKLDQVELEDNANLRLSVYDANPGAVIDGDDVHITMAAGSKVDFGGWKEEGNIDWKPDQIKIAANSLTFHVADADSGNVIYLTGVEGNVTTKMENIRVVGDGANNTGDAQADLATLSKLVKYNTKEGTDGTNQLTDADGFTVTQEANDIFDAATGVVADDGTVKNVVTQDNANTHGISEMTAVGLHIWRNEINDMNKRLGELRDSSEESNGVWTRVYNGKAKFGGQNITNKYTAFQFGYDHQVTDGSWLGGALSYTNGDNDFAQGGGDSSLLAFTAYGSKLWNNGMFVDVTGKVGRMKNDFDISLASGTSSASYHTNAVSFSAEAGWRLFPMQNSFFVEPQVELMYGHVFDADYTTSTGVNVNQASADTLIGRAGVVLGLKCPNNRGNAYIRASVLHDWKGDADFTFSKAGGLSRTISEEFGGTWYEYGLGANFNATDRIHLYTDVEASDGGEVDTDYRVNFGVRYAF